MAQLNPQLAPIITPPQLPYEVFEKQANAGVMPEIAALNMLGEIVGEKIPKAVQEKQRLSRLSEVFKGIDSDVTDKLYGKSVADGFKEALIVGGPDAPFKISEAILNLKQEGEKLNFLKDEMKKKYGSDYINARWGEQAAKMPSYVLDELNVDKPLDELKTNITNLNALITPYGFRVTGVQEAKEAGWWSKHFGDGKGTYLPTFEFVGDGEGNKSETVTRKKRTGLTAEEVIQSIFGQQ